MMRVSRVICMNGATPFPVHRDTLKYPKIVTEVGTWHYKKESMSEFQNWCRNHQVRAYGNIKIASDLHFARCLRASKTIYPGQAIITCPYSACFNFLTVAKEIHSASSCTFPIQFDWINYNDRLPYLKSTATYELAMVGWMVRIASLEDSPFTPYIKYLLEDTRGRDGVASGISREREDASGMIDHYFSEMATEACEDPEVFLENLFISFACIRMRTQPIETEAVKAYIPGTNFFKAKAEKMFVPTLMPLIDTVVQREDGFHNTLVQYFPFKDSKTLELQCEELQIPCPKRDEELTVVSEQCTPLGIEKVVNLDHNPMDKTLLVGGGFFALRALQVIEKGELLYVRQYPFEGDAEDRQMHSNIMEATRLLSHHN
ncbi:unnamed protein product [Phytomonas sp. EM1]|nr:unnamed protein product [Phytomonas sp. EM1]|eukprot:CCW63627.1 unnamed protein product [Phytomonas sp. isolate EM1]